jgi:hypothetical protein
VLDETGVSGSGPASGRRRARGLAGATVLLCGTGTYSRGSKLTNIPAVKATLADLGEVLVERCGAPKPTTAADPRTLSDLGAAISSAARRADTVLLIYYVGHGLVDADGHLFLATAQTDPRPDAIQHTGLPYQTVRSYVRNSSAPLKIVILDCCYSGIAVGNLGSDHDMEHRAAIEGAYVLTSAARDEASIAPPRERHTAFTGALIALLELGDQDGAQLITLDSVYEYLARVLPAAGYPHPRRRVTGEAGALVLAANPAHGGDPPGRHPLPPPRRRVRVPVVLSTVLAGTALVPVLASLRYGGTWRPPPAGVRGEVLRAWWGLLLLAATATLVTVVIVGPTAHWITRVAVRSRWRPLRRLRVPLLAMTAFVLAALLGGTAVTAAASARVWLATCPTTAVVSVLAPIGSHEPAAELARGFERDTAAGNFGCPVARLLVYSATAARIDTALARGWGDDEHLGIGPAPDVWLPDWSGEVRHATAAATVAGRTLPYADIRTIASTPVVLGVSAGSASATEAGLTDGVVWPYLIDTMRGHGWAAVAPDPETSVGALARVPLYHPAGGSGGRREPADVVERFIDKSLDQGKFALGSDAAALLCAPGGIRDRIGYVMTEQDVARFNHGDPLGPSCPQQPPGRLRAVYAADTPVLDRQVVRFGWPQASTAQSRAAVSFVTWLTGAHGRDALAAAGLRPPESVTRAPLSPEWGVQPDLQPRPAVISPDLVTDARTRYQQAHRYARVLIAVDASGSMGLGGAADSPWTAAAEGVTKAAKDWRDSDNELGVLAFQDSGADGIRKLVPPGRPDPDAVAAALGRITPRGPAPLFSAVVAALAEVGPSTADRVTAVILLTDGENDNASALNTSQFRAAVDGKGVRVFAVAMGATGCAAPVLKTITTATAGTCLEAEPGPAADPLTTILEAVR